MLQLLSTNKIAEKQLSKEEISYISLFFKVRTYREKLNKTKNRDKRKKLNTELQKLRSKMDELLITGITPLSLLRSFRNQQKHRKLKILSCGAGMQSTALALMSCENAIAGRRIHKQVPIYDAILFCDLGFEASWVYEQVRFIQNACASAGIPFHIIKSDLYRDYLDKFGREHVRSIPFWTVSPSGKHGKMMRVCTITYKIEMMTKFVRARYLQYKLGQKNRILDFDMVEMHIGFSYEERSRRAKNSHMLFHNKYPLVYMKWERIDSYRHCLEVWGLDTKGSACAFCPFHKNYFFLYLKEHYPDDYLKLLEFDQMLEKMQPHSKIDSKLYISPSRKRIRDLTQDECQDAQVFQYNDLLVWNGF